jgi:hypothetical protein
MTYWFWPIVQAGELVDEAFSGSRRVCESLDQYFQVGFRYRGFSEGGEA